MSAVAPSTPVTEGRRSPADAVVFRARGVQLGYGPEAILSHVDLEIRRGDFWFLIGPNGSGKTTLLRALLGLLPPRAGLLERNPVLTAREHLGFVPQSCDINPTLPTTVREFVSLGFVRSGVPKVARPRQLRESLELVGLAGREHASYWSLSGGQRQRALVARALVRRPQLVVLDEPTEWLDVASEDVLLRTLVELNQAGMTLLLVTHKLTLAARFASHVALFDAGHVVAGPRDAILEPSQIERVFGVAADLRPPDALRSSRAATGREGGRE
jgi:ABC-type Mn2+/Zn2+ transport system ATPase subunit